METHLIWGLWEPWLWDTRLSHIPTLQQEPDSSVQSHRERAEDGKYSLSPPYSAPGLRGLPLRMCSLGPSSSRPHLQVRWEVRGVSQLPAGARARHHNATRVASSFGESGFIVAEAEAGSLGPPSGPGGTPQCPGLAWTLALGRWVRCSQFGSGRLQRRWSWDPLGAGVWSVWGANTRPRLHLTGERWVDKRWSRWPSVSRCVGQLCSGTRETWSVPAVPHVLWAGELTWSRVR